MEEGGDWDRRNRLKTYEAIYLMSIRDFKRAADIFLETLATFTSYEITPYNTFIEYLVFMATLTHDRVTIKEKVIDSPGILPTHPPSYYYFPSYYVLLNHVLIRSEIS